MTLGTTADWMHIARDTAHSQLRAKSQLLCIGWRKLKTSLATTTTLTAYGSWWRRIMTGGVWLPCAPGSTVYQITVSVCKWRDADKCHSYCDGYGDCWEGERIVEPVQFEPCMIARIGKTVFLTREAAESALANKENHVKN